MDKDLYDSVYNLYGDMTKLYEAIDKIHNKLYHFENLKDDIKNVENGLKDIKSERENKSFNNYFCFIIVVSAFIALFVSAICCGISCSNRVKVEETPTEMRINLDNPQNKDIQLHINHG